MHNEKPVRLLVLCIYCIYSCTLIWYRIVLYIPYYIYAIYNIDKCTLYYTYTTIKAPSKIANSSY